MAKVIRNIEMTKEEAQILVKALALVDNLTDDLELTLASFFDRLNDIRVCEDVSTGQDLNGKVVTDNYDDYEFKIVDKLS